MVNKMDETKESKHLEFLSDYDLLLDFHNFEEFIIKKTKNLKVNMEIFDKELFPYKNNPNSKDNFLKPSKKEMT